MPPFQPKAIVPVPAPTEPSSTGPPRACAIACPIVAAVSDRADVVQVAAIRFAD
jgi:hypothetical protein